MDNQSSPTVISSVPYIPRSNVLSRFNGTLLHLIQEIRNQSKTMSLSETTVTTALKISLRSFSSLLQDTDNSIQSGTEYNGHNLLTKLTMHPDEEVNETVAECISIINKVLPPGITFPILQGLLQYPPYPLQFHYLYPSYYYPYHHHTINSTVTSDNRDEPSKTSVVRDTMDKDIFRYTHIYDRILALASSDDSIEGWSNDEANLSSSSFFVPSYDYLRIYQRCIPPWMHRQTSQDDVGQMLWPAAIPMSRWLIQHRYLFPYQSICEIGSGMGLCGILTAILKYNGEQEYEKYCRTNNSVTDSFISSTVKYSYYRFLQSRKESSTASASKSTAPQWPVIVSDFNPLVLHNLYYNTTLNEPCFHANSGTDDSSLSPILANVGVPSVDNPPPTNLLPNVTSPLLRTVRVDWNIYKDNIINSNAAHVSSEYPTDNVLYSSFSSSTSSSSTDSPYYQNIYGVHKQLDFTHTYDIILGSDMICSAEDCRGVGSLLTVHLAKPYGIGIFMLAPSDVRWGVEQLAPILKEYGLHVETRTIPGSYVDKPNKYYSFDSSNVNEVNESNRIPPDIHAKLQHSSPSGVEDWVQKSNDIIDVVVAGGYEQRLQLHIVTWKIT